MKFTTTILALILLLCPWLAFAAPPPASPEPVTITLPAAVLHKSLINALPFSLAPESDEIKGSISIDTIDVFEIHDGMISLQGAISGHNLAITTSLAGQHFDIQVGEVQLPRISCNLLVRFDQARQLLLLTPKFDQLGTPDPNDPVIAILPLLALLDGKEQSVPMNNIAPFNARLGNRDIPITLQPIDVVAQTGRLLLKLVPEVGKTKL